MSQNRKLVKKVTKETSISESVGVSAPAELTPAESKKIDEINKPKKDWSARRYCLVINNPLTCSPPMTHEIIKDILLNKLTGTEYFCMADEIGEQGTPHTHVYIIFKNNAHKRFSVIKNSFPNAHIEKANGSHNDNVMYIKKEGKWKDTKKAETSVLNSFESFGELPKSEDAPTREAERLEMIQIFIEQGLSPNEIMRKNVVYIKYKSIIREAYFLKRESETPVIRDVTVEYHVGASGSGKTYTYVKLCEEVGENNVYLWTDYANSGSTGLDNYCGEKWFFIDEVKPNSISFSLLLIVLDRHKADLHARHTNVRSLWSNICITSVFSVEHLYSKMVDESQKVDSIQQLKRRITTMVYHAKDTKGKFYTYSIPMTDYVNYNTLITQASRYYMEQGIELLCEPISEHSDTSTYKTGHMDF